MAKSIGIHFFEFEDMFRCYRDNENLKKHFGHMDTLTLVCKCPSENKASASSLHSVHCVYLLKCPSEAMPFLLTNIIRF